MFVVVGRIGRPHGIRGEVTIEVLTDDPEARFAPGSVLQTDPEDVGPLTVSSTRHSGRISLVLFEGITDRNEAEALRDTLLRVDIDDLPPLDHVDDFYDHELIGLVAKHTDGSELGTVRGVLHAPAAPVLEISRAGGGLELVPFVSAIVTEVDRDAGTLTIDPPEGMFG